jgi:hypothetical protein
MKAKLLAISPMRPPAVQRYAPNIIDSQTPKTRAAVDSHPPHQSGLKALFFPENIESGRAAIAHDRPGDVAGTVTGLTIGTSAS